MERAFSAFSFCNEALERLRDVYKNVHSVFGIGHLDLGTLTPELMFVITKTH